MSGDKDFMQLINDSTFLYAPQARKREKEIFDVNKVVEKWGVGLKTSLICLVLWEIALIMFQVFKELVQKQP